MRIEDKVKQHDELISELMRMVDVSSRRLSIMERVQSIVIPVLVITGFSGVMALLKVFGAF